MPMGKRNLLVVLLTCLLAAAAIAEKIYCGRCGQAIAGRYITYSINGKSTLTVCQECDRRLPHCSACNLPFNPKDLTTHKGEKLCRSCLADSIYCNLCGKRIEGKFFQSKDGQEKYCARCYYSYPRCAACDRPGPVHRLSNGKTVCDKCLATLPRCGACNQPIVGTYYQFDTSDQSFCENCKKTAHKCYTCGVPLGPKHWLFDDGRRICNACNNRAVYDIAQIRAIMKDVQKLCTENLGLPIKIPFELQVKDLNKQSSADAMKAKEGKNGDSPLFGKELGLFRLMNGKTEIFLLYGLPIEMLYDTAAHEYAHAWQAENCPADQSPELLEGFAQWVSSQVLRIKNFDKALERLEARTDRPYGTGYHQVKRLEQSLGRAGLMEYIEKNRK